MACVYTFDIKTHPVGHHECDFVILLMTANSTASLPPDLKIAATKRFAYHSAKIKKMGLMEYLNSMQIFIIIVRQYLKTYENCCHLANQALLASYCFHCKTAITFCLF